MKKSINFVNIGVVLIGYFVLTFIFNLISAIRLRKRNSVTMQPPIIQAETQEENKIGFKPTDPQDEFFIKEDVKDPNQ